VQFVTTSEKFDLIYRANSSLVFNFLRRFLIDSEEAEDATVETFRRVHVGLPKFRGDCSERTWVMRIATSVAIRAKEQLSRNQTLSLDAMAVEREDGRRWEPASREDIETTTLNSDFARSLLASLPEQQRAAVWLRVGLEHSDSEVAEILQVPVGTVKAWVWRSLIKLRKECAAAEQCGKVEAS